MSTSNLVRRGLRRALVLLALCALGTTPLLDAVSGRNVAEATGSKLVDASASSSRPATLAQAESRAERCVRDGHSWDAARNICQLQRRSSPETQARIDQQRQQHDAFMEALGQQVEQSGARAGQRAARREQECLRAGNDWDGQTCTLSEANRQARQRQQEAALEQLRARHAEHCIQAGHHWDGQDCQVDLEQALDRLMIELAATCIDDLNHWDGEHCHETPAGRCLRDSNHWDGQACHETPDGRERREAEIAALEAQRAARELRRLECLRENPLSLAC
jgi:hypothetical protein